MSAPVSRDVASALLRYVECRRRYERIDSASFVVTSNGGVEFDVKQSDVNGVRKEMIDARETLAALVGGMVNGDRATQILAIASLEKS